MEPILVAFVIVTCTRYAVIGYMVLAAWRSGKGYFVAAALVIALLGGYSIKSSPDVCPQCGHILKRNGVLQEAY